VNVTYSSINYKDALAVTGRGKIIRGEFPFVPGIDLAGTVVESDSSLFTPGDEVIATGWGLGENFWGGYTEYQRVRSEWLVPVPAGLDLRTTMGFGTAGLTAMLAVTAIESNGIDPSDGEVVVTGATGGVGSMAILILAALGYKVVASTGKPDAHAYLRRLGASTIIDRGILSAGAARPLDTGSWAAALDSVGGSTLSAILSRVKLHGVVASCGLVGGAEFESTVYPFILRGVSLVGIDSNTCPTALRTSAWERIARILPGNDVLQTVRMVQLQDVMDACEEVLAGRITGRIVVSVSGDDAWRTVQEGGRSKDLLRT
jgi:acrylyl-CoA reductase (NADPH)